MAGAKRSIVLALLCGLLWHDASAAQDGDASERIEVLNKRAMEDYDLLEFGEAKKLLVEAVEIIKRSHTEGELAAKTYLNLAVVTIAGLKDRYKGLTYFVKALQ